MDAKLLEFTVGDRMRKAREVARLNQSEMAAELQRRGVRCKNHTTVSSWETGTQPRAFVETLNAWAEICQVPAAWLLTGDANALALSGQYEIRLVA